MSAGEVSQPGERPLGEPQQRLLRQLLAVWLQFERDLDNVPVLRRLLSGQFEAGDYRRVLLNLRQQVVEGSRWIARAASSFDSQYLELRSLVLQHAREEHRDYEMLERDYLEAGGNPSELRSTEKNVGSEALHGYLMYRSSLPNPLGLLGAMFIIEGLGQKMASEWAQRIREQTGLGENATRFLSYHGHNDDAHLGKLQHVLETEELSDAVARDVVKVARVVARLYRLQLEELDVR